MRKNQVIINYTALHLVLCLFIHKGFAEKNHMLIMVISNGTGR